MRDTVEWKRLRSLIEEIGVSRGEFKLSSGGTSNIYFDLRRVTLHPEASSLIAELLLGEMKALGVNAVCGPAVAAVPIVSVLSAMSWSPQSSRQMRGFEASFVRSAKKTHGTEQQVEGHLPRSGPVLLVDDVATRGRSILDCYNAIKEVVEPNEAQLAYVILDREEGATDLLAENRIELRSMFRASDFQHA